MRLTRATGQYRQLITNDLKALISKGLVEAAEKRGRIIYYYTTPYGLKALDLLNKPLTLSPIETP